jgi:hypothetical protein
MNINKIKMWLEKSHLSVLKTHWSAGTNVHLNRNKTNYKSSLGMGIGVASDYRRQIAPNITPVPPPSVKELVETHQSTVDSTDRCRQVSGT